MERTSPKIAMDVQMQWPMGQHPPRPRMASRPTSRAEWAKTQSIRSRQPARWARGTISRRLASQRTDSKSQRTSATYNMGPRMVTITKAIGVSGCPSMTRMATSQVYGGWPSTRPQSMESEILASQGRPRMGLEIKAIGAIGITTANRGRPQSITRSQIIGAIARDRTSAQMMPGTAAGGPIKTLIRGTIAGASNR